MLDQNNFKKDFPFDNFNCQNNNNRKIGKSVETNAWVEFIITKATDGKIRKHYVFVKF